MFPVARRPEYCSDMGQAVTGWPWRWRRRDASERR